MFLDDIDNERKIDNENGKIQNGYSFYDFDADVDLQTLKSWSDKSPSFWENWLNFGLGAAFTGGPNEESKTVAPIQILKESDMQGTNKEISNRLLINYADVETLKKEYDEATTISGVNDEEKVVVLFRFATSNYYSEAVDIIELGKGFLWTDIHTKGQAYIAQESVFFDFDVIQLTFNKAGIYTVLSTVTSPIDIIDDITPPTSLNDGLTWWQILLMLLFIILLIEILWPILPFVICAIWWLICLIFNGLKWLFNKITKRKDKQNKEV